jgi:Large ribosomal RNA subunit accumulation protein YceD
MTDAERPWSATIRLDEVGETGRHVELEAGEAVRVSLSKPAGVDAVERLVARFDLTKRGRDRLHVSGEVSGTVRQTCVVTLEPVMNNIKEAIDVTFASPREPGSETAQIDIDAAAPTDEIEPLLGNAVDLGLLATEFFLLGIDPYPRKPGVAFDAPKAASDPASHPFAGLAALHKNSTVKK